MRYFKNIHTPTLMLCSTASNHATSLNVIILYSNINDIIYIQSILNTTVICLRKTISQILFTVKILIVLLHCDFVGFNKFNVVSFVHS